MYITQECSNGSPCPGCLSPFPIIATSPVHTREQAGRYIVNSVQQCTVMFIDGVPSTPSNVTLHTTLTHRVTGRHLCWVSVQVLVQGSDVCGGCYHPLRFTSNMGRLEKKIFMTESIAIPNTPLFVRITHNMKTFPFF